MSNKSAKIISVVALIIAIISVSLGFAAFASTLKIKPILIVEPKSELFDIGFKNPEGDSNTITPETEGEPKPSGSVATFDNSDIHNPTLKNLHADFTKPGQKVIYKLKISNNGAYDAYLNSILYSIIKDNDSSKVCTAKSSSNQASVDEVCDGIVLSIKIGDNDTVSSTTFANDLKNNVLSIDSSIDIIVTIEYKKDAKIPSGEFSVTFGDLVLSYSSVNQKTN